MVYTEVSNLKKVKQYIGGGRKKYGDKHIALLLLENQGRALTNDEEDRKIYYALKEKSIQSYLSDYGMRHLYV